MVVSSLLLLLISFSAATYADDGLDCLAHAIYLEARSDGEDGMRAVGSVILRRVGSDRYPNDICVLVWKPSSNPSKPLACSVSAFCDPAVQLGMFEVKASQAAYRVAKGLLYGDLYHYDITFGATHYTTTAIKDKVWWVDKVEETVIIGSHTFYKEER